MGMAGGSNFKWGKGRGPAFKRIGAAKSAGDINDSVFSGGSPLDALNAIAAGNSGGGLGGFLSFCLPGFGRG